MEEAFGSALIISLGVALMTSVLMALLVTGYFTRRVQRSTTNVSHAASRIAEGQFSARVPSGPLGPEFDQLATTINDLAERLGDGGHPAANPRRPRPRDAHPAGHHRGPLEALEDGVRVLDEPTWRHSTAAPSGCTAWPRTSAPSHAPRASWTPTPVHTSPRQLLEAAAAAAQDAYDAGQVRLTVDATGPLPDIHVDPERMGQVLANLSRTPYGTPHPAGRSTSRQADRPPLGGAGRHRHRRGDRTRAPPHIFERFYRADPARRRQPGQRQRHRPDDQPRPGRGARRRPVGAQRRPRPRRHLQHPPAGRTGSVGSA